MKELELYIHIPFCVQKCKYCDFLSAPSTCKERTLYLETLKKEIRSYRKAAREYEVTSVFVGGGTPTTLDASQLEDLFETLREVFLFAEDAEITVEMNPGTVDQEKLEALKAAGVNRLSIGLQSVNDSELQMLGRIHTFAEFLETYQLAVEAGFSNINVDLISAIPFQTTESWKHTLEVVTSLKPQPKHISAYSLIIEAGTPFYERYGEGGHQEELPDEDAERQMYQDTKETLESLGYHRYEISNYAKDGYECKHNCGYWQRKEYLGLGLGAASLMNETRWSNPGTMEEYLEVVKQGVQVCETAGDADDSLCRDVAGVYGFEAGMAEEISEKEVLTREDQMAEFMFLGLRMICGVNREEFLRCFGVSMEEVYGDVLEKFIKEALIEKEQDHYRLTARGLDVSNYVMSEFLL